MSSQSESDSSTALPFVELDWPEGAIPPNLPRCPCPVCRLRWLVCVMDADDPALPGVCVMLGLTIADVSLSGAQVAYLRSAMSRTVRAWAEGRLACQQHHPDAGHAFLARASVAGRA